jgi:hypothetical protein
MHQRIMAILIPALIATGCAQAPTDMLSTAERAVNDARAAGAQTYLAEEFAKLEGMLADARNEIAEQDAKVGFLRDYERAEQALSAVETDAARVIVETAKRKEEAKTAAVQAQQAAQEAVKQVQGLVARAPVGKERAALEAIKADVDGLTTSMNEVQMAIDAGDYNTAQSKAQAIHQKSQQVSGEIETAIGKIRKAKLAKKK